MEVNIKKILKDMNGQAPVIYLHWGKKEELVTALVDPKWLDRIWQVAVQAGYKDSQCTEAGQDVGFMPHTHFTEEDYKNLQQHGKSNIW